MRAVQRAEEVNAHHAFHGFEIGILKEPAHGQPGRADQDVEAPETGDGFLDCLPALLGNRDVGRHGQAFRAAADDRGHRVVEGALIARRNNQFGAEARQAQGRRLADAG